LILITLCIFIILVALSLNVSIRRSLIFSISLSLITLVLLIQGGVSLIPIIICLLILNLTPVFCVKIADNLIRIKRDIKHKLEAVETDYEDLLNKQHMIKEQNTNLNQGLNGLVSLYDATKEMNTSLHYPELFEAFNNMLREHFTFGGGFLSLIEKEDDIDEQEAEDAKTDVEKEISFNKVGFLLQSSGQIIQPTRGKNEESAYVNKILKTVTKETKQQLLKQAQVQSFIPGLELKSDLKTLALVPIGMETSAPLVFIGENFSEDDFSKLLILCRQLSMEVQRVSLYEKVQELAITDGLTRLLARRRFLERMREELERSLRYGLEISMLMLDIDHFKDYNDRYGHLVGDVVLRETASIIKNSLSGIDLAGRYGGEEFCVILPETNKKGALQVAERIRWAVENHSFAAYDEVTNVTLSIGVSTFPDDGMLMEELINNADKALYKAKETGRNRICDYAKL